MYYIKRFIIASKTESGEKISETLSLLDDTVLQAL